MRTEVGLAFSKWRLKMAVVIYSEQYGVLLRRSEVLQRAFWSKIRPEGYTHAQTFDSVQAAKDCGLIVDWNTVRFLPIVPDCGKYASEAACIAVGVPAWTDKGKKRQHRIELV
jgi:hypothetical protein